VGWDVRPPRGQEIDVRVIQLGLVLGLGACVMAGAVLVMVPVIAWLASWLAPIFWAWLAP
jgi:hypothetical protein